MDTNIFVKAVIGISILVLVIVLVLVPILSNIEQTSTEANEPTRYATASVPSGTYTLANGGFAINGQAISTLENTEWFIISDSISMMMWNNQIRVYDYATDDYISTDSVTVSGQTWTALSGGATHTGTLGNNAICVSRSGDLGVYYRQSFIVDRTQDVLFFKITSNFTHNGESVSIRAIVSGTLDDLKVKNAALFGNETTHLNPDSITVSFGENDITEYNRRTYQIASNPTVSLNVTLNGTEYNISSGFPVAIAAPVNYTVIEEGAINSMIGVVPLLMLAGVIVMSIGYFIARRS